MYQVLTLNNISPKGIERLPASLFQMTEDIDEAAGILVRSQNMKEMQLPEGLLAVARAGAGTNNIPIDRCTAQGIAVFNTPGANANAVKELTIAGLVLACRNIAPALSWVQTLAGAGDEVGKLVEKGKSRFVGPELAGKRLGVIGLGAIGVKVANTASRRQEVVLQFEGLKRRQALSPEAPVVVMQSDDKNAVNTFKNPEAVVPQRVTAVVEGNNCRYTLAPQSFQVIIIPIISKQ